ncbi:MAG: polyphosphate kinase 1 [Chloroflexota bacterium]
MQPETESIDLNSPRLFLNRELSMIEFNERVLAEAEEPSHPLLERLKFISIFSSNMDEFFMIRVAGLKGLIAAGIADLSYDGLTPREQLLEIRKRLIPLYERQGNLLNEVILAELERRGIVISGFETLSDEEKIFLDEYFMQKVLPVLTPLTLGPTNPFPRIINRNINIAFVIKDNRKQQPEERVAFVQIPAMLQRFVELPAREGMNFVLLEEVITAYAQSLFPGFEIDSAYTFRVTRDADIEIAEDEAEDLLTEVAEQIKRRRWGRAAVRLEVFHEMPKKIVNLLMETLELEPEDVYVYNRPVNMPDFMQLANLPIGDLRDKPFNSYALPEFSAAGAGVFDAVKQHDFLVHHPFDSFSSSTLKFLYDASSDPDVMAIKITLYRTGMNSPVVSSLIKAAENGKYVTAFVELKARFDEENNIIWAKQLEAAGVHVVYGVPGLKTHAKIAIVVRRESGILKTYLHLSTGNYNATTSRLYTDMGFFTANEDFALDAIHLFNYLTGYSHVKDWRKFTVAPLNLKKKLIDLINREAELHTEENPGLIIAKMNSLAHREVIPALYRASQAGVRIKLLVRGVCCLKPGIEGVSSNIEVRSILGRFLEHSRIFYFKNGGKKEFYLSSADWMSRNLHNRVEVMFPIEDPNLQSSLRDALRIYWKDNTKAWKLLPDGSYVKLEPANGEEPFCAQDYFLRAERHRKSVKSAKRSSSR